MSRPQASAFSPFLKTAITVARERKKTKREIFLKAYDWEIARLNVDFLVDRSHGAVQELPCEFVFSAKRARLIHES